MRRVFSILFLSALLIGQSGCLKKKDVLKEHMTGSWDVNNYCDEFGTMIFDNDNTGQLHVNEECEVGSSCLNVLPFDWAVDEKTGLLTVTYDPSGSALMVCSSIQQTAPPAESTIVSKDTQVIIFYGYSFTKR
ncbi:MAG: hypothetical protein GC178_04495 [Flavobacteriales bacterium]|nr:hypothetical protein [Flavobacteriales bacterium]